MGIPLSGLTFARMPDASPVGVLVSDLLDALYASLSSPTDYRGTALPATHLPTVGQRRPTVVTEAVDLAFPAGTMTMAPMLHWAGRISAAGTMASPDTSLTLVMQAGITKNNTGYSDWTDASPAGGQFSGYWRCDTVAANAVATVVRTFISQEAVFVQIVSPTVTNQFWWYGGAIVEPYSADVINDAEADNRLYGMFTCGHQTVSSTWPNTNAAMFNHTTTANTSHGCVFTPGSGTIMPCGKTNLRASAASVDELRTLGGTLVGDVLQVGKSVGSNDNSGNRLGVLRGIYHAGSVQSGTYDRNGSTDLYHYISTNTTAAGAGFRLPALP